MTLRPAGPGDAPAIAGVEAASAFAPWSEQAARDTLALPSTVALVAEEGGAVVGHLLASAVPPAGELLTVAVAPEARRRGVGRGLLEAVERAWREREVREAFLEVREDNVGALRLYEAAGWAPVGRRTRYYRDGRDALVLRREIGS